MSSVPIDQSTNQASFPARRRPTLLDAPGYAELLRGLEPGHCVFCGGAPDQRVLIADAHAMWLVCRRPYRRWHTLILPIRHAVRLDDCAPVEMAAVFGMRKCALDILRGMSGVAHEDGALITDWTTLWRERTAFEGGHNAHLHLHVIPERKGLFEAIIHPEAHADRWHDRIVEAVRVHDRA